MRKCLNLLFDHKGIGVSVCSNLYFSYYDENLRKLLFCNMEKCVADEAISHRGDGCNAAT